MACDEVVMEVGTGPARTGSFSMRLPALATTLRCQYAVTLCSLCSAACGNRSADEALQYLEERHDAQDQVDIVLVDFDLSPPASQPLLTPISTGFHVAAALDALQVATTPNGFNFKPLVAMVTDNAHALLGALPLQVW